MKFIERIEEACAAFVEKTFAKTFRSALEPAQVARKLVATMEAQRVQAPGEMQARTRYLVRVSAEDYERLSPHRAHLEREWSALLADMARRVHMGVGAVPMVFLERDDAVVSGSVRIEVAPASRRLMLRVAKGVPLNARIPLTDLTIIGRDDDCDLVLSDPGVSRHHVRVQTSDGVHVINDLDSTNGTFVNGERVEQARLGSGDVIVLGSTHVCVEEAAE